MEVGVRVEAENPRSGERRHTSTAYLTMVALDEDGTPDAGPAARGESEAEKRRQREAELRRSNRLAEREQILRERGEARAETGGPPARHGSLERGRWPPPRDANLACARAAHAQARPATGGSARRLSEMAPDRPQLRKLAIVPAYNEEGMVGRVVREIRRQAPGFDVVVVDDGSTDDDRGRGRGQGAVVLRHPFNPGIGGAMQSGFKYALRHGYDVAAQVDGDGQHKPAYLHDLLAKLQTSGDEADMVCGSRFRGDPGYKVPFGRRVGNLIFSVVLTAITRQRITDPTSGFRMTNRRGIELFARDYPHDYPEVEAILMLHAHRLRIHEVPVRMNARGFGRSSIDYPRSAYYMAKVLLALFVGLFRRRPTPVDEAPDAEGSRSRPAPRYRGGGEPAADEHRARPLPLAAASSTAASGSRR